MARRDSATKEMYAPDLGEEEFAFEEGEIQLLLHLNFPNALLKRFSISEHLVIMQHEKEERHANERSQSKYR
jgi:hypothetical protein